MKHIQKLTTRNGNKGTIIKAHQSAVKPVESKAKIVVNKVEIPKPLINVLTRTSGRPLAFKRCHESVKNQTYQNVRHIVSIDNLQDEEYVKQYEVDYYLMDKDAISKEADIPDPRTGPRFIYNLYLNKLIEKVTDGWIIILDDDDYLADNNVLQKVANLAKSNTDMLLWQMKYPNGGLLPSLQELGTPPRLARISSQCFAVHSGVAKTIKWDGWKCGDFRFIQKVWMKTVDKRVIKEPLVYLGGVGLGQRNDIGANTDMLNKVSTNSSEISGNAVLNLLKGSSNVNTNQNLNVNIPLNNFLNSNDEIRKDIHIIAVGWNCSKFINDFYNSVSNQIISNYDLTIHMLDDGSTDNSYNEILKIARKDNRVKHYRNEKNMGATYSRYIIAKDINDESILVFVDLDDMIKKDLIKIINSIYQNEKIYFTMGQYECMSGRTPNLKCYTDEIINNKSYDKNSTFDVPHTKTCISKYFKNIPENFFKDSNGKWYMYCTDVTFCLGVLNQCKSENVYKLQYKGYIYRDNRKSNTLDRFTKKQKDKIRDEIKNKLKHIKYKYDYSNINSLQPQ